MSFSAVRCVSTPENPSITISRPNSEYYSFLVSFLTIYSLFLPGWSTRIHRIDRVIFITYDCNHVDNIVKISLVVHVHVGIAMSMN